MVIQKRISLLFLVAMATVQVVFTDPICPVGTISYLKDHENRKDIWSKFPTPTCEACPENCIQCHHRVSNSEKPAETTCLACNIGFFLNDFTDTHTQNTLQRCEKCSENCANCVGKLESQCTELKIGIQYDGSKTFKCGQNCQTCNKKAPNNCVSCDFGFKINHKGECVSCEKENCSLCSNISPLVAKIFQQSEICGQCKVGYGFKNGKKELGCGVCPPGCSQCHANNSQCQSCTLGYFLNHETQQCEAKEFSDNCFVWDFKKDKCDSCHQGYFLNKIQSPTDSKKFFYRCELCSKLSYACQLCRNVDESSNYLPQSEYSNPLFSNQAQCTTCIDGFYFNYKERKCVANSPYCSRQVEWYTGDKEFYKCDLCIRNYSFDQEAMLCQKNEAKFKYCVFSYSNEACSVCEDGFYNTKEGGCQKCHDSCPTCNGPTQNDCTSCSFSKFRLALKKNDKSVWVDPVYKCINECSAIIEGRSYVESLSTNDCVLNTEHKHEEEPKPEEKKYNFKIIDSNPDALKLQEELQNNISKLYQYVMEDLKLRQKLKEAKKLQPEAEDICNLQGRIREEIGEDQETSLYCECFENAFGSRCQYYSELFYEFNSYAELVLRKVSLRIKAEDVNGVKIIQQLISVPLSLSNTRILKDFLLRNISHVHLSGSDSHLQLFLRAFDIALAQMYEILAEDSRRVHGSKDIDVVYERKQLSKDILGVLNMLQRFVDLNVDVEQAEIAKRYTLNRAFSIRIFDKNTIFYNLSLPEDPKTRVLPIANRDEIQELSIAVPYVNSAFSGHNDLIQFRFSKKDENNLIVDAFNYESDPSKQNKIGLKFLGMVISTPLFPKAPQLEFPYLSPVLQFAAHFDNHSYTMNDSAYQLPKSVHLALKFPLLIVPVNTEKFVPQCVKITQNRTNPSDFKVVSTTGSSKITTEPLSGRIIVECDLSIDIWDQVTGKQPSFIQWLTVIASDKKLDGGGKENEWKKRTAHIKTGEANWNFEEYDIKALVEGYSRMIAKTGALILLLTSLLN